MKKITPNYKDFAFADIMGNRLKTLVEEQLISDLRNYKIDDNKLKFDWSESCIEGHRVNYLDGAVENFSSISVFDEQDNYIAHGWMEFIHDEATNYFIAYWEYVRTYNGEAIIAAKEKPGIPQHVSLQLPKELQNRY